MSYPVFKFEMISHRMWTRRVRLQDNAPALRVGKMVLSVAKGSNLETNRARGQCNSSSMAGITSCKSPSSAKCAAFIIGALGSLLMATITLAPLMPAMC